MRIFIAASSLLLLAAHFLRAGALPILAAVVVLLFLLAVQRSWAARTVQLALLLGAAEWVWTLIRIARARLAAGEPAGRLVLILGSVTAVTLVAAIGMGKLARLYADGEGS